VDGMDRNQSEQTRVKTLEKLKHLWHACLYFQESKMPQERLSMRKIREIMRLYYEKELLQRAVAQACRVSHSTVKEYVSRAPAARLSRPLLEELSEEELYRRLYPEKEKPASTGKTLPDWQ